MVKMNDLDFGNYRKNIQIVHQNPCYIVHNVGEQAVSGRISAIPPIDPKRPIPQYFRNGLAELLPLGLQCRMCEKAKSVSVNDFPDNQNDPEERFRGNVSHC